MGAKHNIDMTVNTDKVKIVAAVDPNSVTDQDTTEPKTSADQTKTKKIKAKKQRSKKYLAARSVIDKSKAYSPKEAVELILKAAYAKFGGSITADLVTKEVGDQAKITFPHSTGKTVKVAIASDELIKQIEAGNIDFAILLSKSEFIPKLAKFARVLGPKGLMPNPKNGTITQQPEKVKAELEKGSLTIKTERKSPLAHITIGNTKMSAEQLSANLEALIAALPFKLLKVSLSATMSPSVRVKLD